MNVAEKLVTIAENVRKVYEAGVKAGQGGSAGYDTFWDAYQQNGNRTDYKYAFYQWPDGSFTPKYTIRPTEANGQLMFYETNITDLAGLLEANEIELDCSQTTSLYQAFASARLTTIPPLNVAACADLTLAFRYAQATTIKLTNLSANCKFDRTFNSCMKLENLEIEGTIGTVTSNGFYVKDSPNLSAASIKNVLTSLTTTPASGSKVYFNATALSNAKNADSTIQGLIDTATTNGWTIST